MATQKKYVFTALVTDKDQPLDLMAYAIYKADKNEIAESLGLAGKSDEEIDAELQRFHDLVLNSPSLISNYSVRARALGEGLVVEIKDRIKKEAKADFIERVEQLVKTEKSWYNHVGMWVMDAIKGVSSTIIVIILFGGIYSLFLTKEERSNLYSAATQSVVDAASGEIPVVDKFREINAQKEREAQERAAKEQAPKPQN
ncbi:hypothetical protein [Pantoea sp. Acro-807]|uniref:hypothetical protein n=1 Tax=Pantoea sp. Acro-807 TaxID=2608356 RepID=UPI00141A4CB6|nr:hypothetical protein [Pantoea sp. Acro-807]NIE72780.1 hypothetical protein [Pantoea sp. Acro-807]